MLYVLKTFKLIGINLSAAVAVGIIGGMVGAAFAHAIIFVTACREVRPFLLFLLPIGALATQFVYSVLRVKGVGTTDCLISSSSDSVVSFYLAPAVFIGSVITHLLGGSAGREGAALQMGAGIASRVSKLFRLQEENRRSLVLCGMAAVFAAVFGTPFAASIFVFEATKTYKTAYKNILYVAVSSLSAYAAAVLLRVQAERFVLPKFSLNFNVFWRVVLAAALAGVVCFCYCTALHFSKKLFAFLKNPYFRGIAGAFAVIALTVLIGNQNYNGTGAHIIHSVLNGERPVLYAFAIKILLTVLTVGAGFKGGEIVPALFIGATFGAAAATLLGVPSVLGAAICMIVLFAGSTKCILAALIISLELFGFNLSLSVYLVPALIIGCVFSGKVSIYKGLKFK